MSKTETYNGWANYETWNVALWISNDYTLYALARDYAALAAEPSYTEFIETHQTAIDRAVRYYDYDNAPMTTPDNVSWLDLALDYAELDEFIRTLA